MNDVVLMYASDCGQVLAMDEMSLLKEVQLLVSGRINTQLCRPTDGITKDTYRSIKIIFPTFGEMYYVNQNPFLDKSVEFQVSSEPTVDKEIQEYIDYVIYTLTRFGFYMSGTNMRSASEEYYDEVMNTVNSLYLGDKVVQDFITDEKRYRKTFLQDFHYDSVLSQIRLACAVSPSLHELKDTLQHLAITTGAIAWPI